MKDYILGIHHITAISGDPELNLEFYTKILGLRLVKKTVNFDDPETYHLYFGNEKGEPGTIITFFPWGSKGFRGRIGSGQVSVTSFSIPLGSMDFWIDRLKKNGISQSDIQSRFDEEFISFYDPDGIRLELVECKDGRSAWITEDIPDKYAIRGFYSASFSVEGFERTAGFLTETFGFKKTEESANRFRYKLNHGAPGMIIDILCEPDGVPGRVGVGTVHHIAFRTPDDNSQKRLRSKILDLGFNVTPVLDRNYFKSIYFREPGHVLFELATDPPGFTIDEKLENLGRELRLPSWLEHQRLKIEKQLPILKSQL